MDYIVKVPEFDEKDAVVFISKWYKSTGDKVTRGELIADADSDTVMCEIVAPVSGVINTIFVAEGKGTRIGGQIASIYVPDDSSTFATSETVKAPAKAELEGTFNDSPIATNATIESGSGTEDITSHTAPQQSLQNEKIIEESVEQVIEAEKEELEKEIIEEIIEVEEEKEELQRELDDIKDEIDATAAFTSKEFEKQEEAEIKQKLEEEVENVRIAEAEIDAEIAFGGVVDGDKSPEKTLNENISKIKNETGLSATEILHNIEQNKDFHTYHNDQADVDQANRLSKIISDDKPATDPELWNKVKRIDDITEKIKELNEVELSFANRRLLASNSAVISTVINEIDMTAIIDAAKFFGDEFYDKYSLHLGFTAFILKALVKALKLYPMFNAYIVDNEKAVYKQNYDISIVTQGLDSSPAPVIRSVDNKNIHELQKYVTLLSKRAQSGELTLEESSGATFTLINAGTYGSLLGSDVVTHPQIAALTMHKVCNRAVVYDGDIVAKPMMYISMSFDHRIANSQAASMFLDTVKRLSENLSWMALGI